MRGRFALACFGVVLAGCGGHGNERRDAVNAYFDRIDRAQASLVGKSGSIDTAFRRFSLTANTPSEVAALVRAQAEIAKAQRQVGAIVPPPDARRLHVDLVRVLALEESMANELVWTARYVPQLTHALLPLPGASKTLAADLRRAKTWPQDAAAFARYRRALAPILVRLDRLSAPPALRPSLVGERQVLRRSVALCTSVEQALAKRKVAEANAGIKALFGVATGPNADRTRTGQIAAAKAYNARLAAISTLAVKVQQERLSLVRLIG